MGSSSRRSERDATPPQDPEPARAARSRALAAGAVLALLFLLAAWIRFGGLTERGLYGSDTVYYTQIARSWSEGDFVYGVGERRATHRPVVFALFGAALAVFGHHDAAIPWLTAGLDCLNILLVFALFRLLEPARPWLAAWGAGLYAFLPFAVYQSRIELTHTLSTTATLLSVTLFLRALGASSSPGLQAARLAACGAATGVAALIHEDLVFLAPGFALILLARGGGGLSRRTVLGSLALLVPLGAVASPMLLFNVGRAGQLAARPAAGGEASAWGEKLLQLPLETARFTWTAIVGSASLPLAVLFFASSLAVTLGLGAAALGAWRSRSWTALESIPGLTPTLLLWVYMACYAFFFEIYFTRALLPFLPLVLAAVGSAAWRLLERALPAAGMAASSPRVPMLALAALLTASCVEQFHERYDALLPAYSSTWAGLDAPLEWRWREAKEEIAEAVYAETWARSIYRALGPGVGPDSRLLITSTLRYPFPGRRTLQTHYYFGDDAVHALDHPEPLERVLEQKKIRYVLYTPLRADARVPYWESYERYLYAGRWRREPLELGSIYGLAREDFTLEREYWTLRRFLEARGARPILASPSFAFGGRPEELLPSGGDFIVYRLPPPDPRPPA